MTCLRSILLSLAADKTGHEENPAPDLPKRIPACYQEEGSLLPGRDPSLMHPLG
jgi:hypothetical protein